MPMDPDLPFEGNLSSLTDDEFFDAIAKMPPILDADGNEVEDVHADVIDARPAKREAEARGETWKPEDFL